LFACVDDRYRRLRFDDVRRQGLEHIEHSEVHPYREQSRQPETLGRHQAPLSSQGDARNDHHECHDFGATYRQWKRYATHHHDIACHDYVDSFDDVYDNDDDNDDDNVDPCRFDWPDNRWPFTK
jgi:hypothetical protein